MDKNDQKRTAVPGTTEVDLVFIASRVRFHEFFAAAIKQRGGLVSPITSSLVTDPAFPLAVQATFLALTYVVQKRNAPAEHLKVVSEIARRQLSEYWHGVRTRLTSIAGMSPYLSSAFDAEDALDQWRGLVLRTMQAEEGNVAFAQDHLYLAIEQKARFDLTTPKQREDFYGPVFQGILNSLYGTIIDFEHRALDEEPLVFTSYASPIENYIGSSSISTLPPRDQDELIRLTLDPEGNAYGYVQDRDLILAEARGLVNVVTAVATCLEKSGSVTDAENPSKEEVDLILEALEDTQLGIRVREALTEPPIRTAKFDWCRLAHLSNSDLFARCNSLTDVIKLIQINFGEADAVSPAVLPAPTDNPSVPARERSDPSSRRGRSESVPIGTAITGSRRVPGVEIFGFLMLGIVGPLKYGIGQSPIFDFLVYLILASFALAFASWMWNPRMQVITSGGWRNFFPYWALRCAHLALVGGILYGLARALS